ncbi:MAG TPA: ABC transporter permease [Solirubrobacteraceae bacterium]|nr:ABC transporter permease [Solirubrobacteraceae bacterium]
MTRQTSLIEQVAAVARRSATGVLRQRALIIFPMLFPLILFAINGTSLSRVTELPGFPTHSYRAFLLAFPFVQGAMFVSISTGTSLARDVESGFLNRLALTPLRSEAMLFGQLGGAFVLGCVQAIVYLLVGLATGVTFVSGVGGVLVLLTLSLTISFAFASLGGLLALRLGTGEAIQGIFPLLFVTLFLSSATLPRNVIGTAWFREVATYNPVSYMVEGLRSLVIQGWNAQALELAFGLSLALAAVSLALARPAMRSRLART